MPVTSRIIAIGIVTVGASAVLALPAAAQTDEQIEAEPLVKLQPGETAVAGQCLTQEELDLIDGLNALTRPTVGVEGRDGGDDPAPFDPHFFVGTWEFESVLPESPLGEAGEYYGTETVRHVEGCTYESRTTATLAGSDVTMTSRLIYDRRAEYMVRIDDDSRGFEVVKVGVLRGDPGGYFSHHWEAPAINLQGSQVRLRGRTYITSPYAMRDRAEISVDGGPFTNFGTVMRDRVDE